MNDEELQEMLDSGDRSMDNTSQEYEKLFSYLGKRDNDILSPGFAHKVTARIEDSKAADPLRRWIIVIFLFMLMVTVVVLSLMINTVPDFRMPGSGQVNIYLMFALMLFMLALYSLIERKGRKDPFSRKHS